MPDAEILHGELNAIRAESAIIWSQELHQDMAGPPLIDSITGIVANASSYVNSDIDTFTERLEADMQSHVAGHLQLIRLCKDALTRNNGAIVAITDIHVNRASKGYLTYQIAKGGLDSAVRALAIDLAPHVRVNAVAPGTLAWPSSNSISAERKSKILESTPLGRIGSFDEMAAAVEFLMFDATFTTGATLTVDGGRSSFLE
jgi:pteridine reductase